ncbi:MAG: hypothetical protein QW568_02905 [Candidatus Anstonellaceae archaeon]
MGKLCDGCKRNGRVWCPHNAALEIRARMQQSFKQEMFGPSPPFVFVGHNHYPNVNWGPMVTSSESKSVDDPAQMYGMTVEQIIEQRASLVRGVKKGNVKLADRMLIEAQEAVMSIKPVDAETRFRHAPVFALELDDVAHPVGASAPIERFRVADNPVVPKKVDEFYNESILAQTALQELLLEGFDVHYLSKLLMSGVLGKKENRKLVPTKWAITATDDTAAKQYMESIRYCKELSVPLVYSNTYLENHFEILLLPGNWEYEQFETALTRELEELHKKKQQKDKLHYSMSNWSEWKYDGRVNISEEHEGFAGRTAYAESQGGGYYAARFGVCEALYRMRRQARAIVFREIGTGYDVPVGVWEVRENVRRAFLNPPEMFQTREEALAHLSEKLCVPLKEYVKRSLILPQRRLNEF